MNLTDYPYIIGALSSWLSAQVIKTLITTSQGYTLWQSLVTSGGMPSSHVALVTTLAALVGFYEGFASAVFGIALTLWGVVLYDSVGVRRVTGENTQIIRRVAKHLKMREPKTALYLTLGHTPYQAFGGFLLGCVCALLIYRLL